MSIENGARFIRKLREDPTLRQRVLNAGDDAFVRVSAAAGASASAYDVVAALTRQLDAEAAAAASGREPVTKAVKAPVKAAVKAKPGRK